MPNNNNKHWRDRKFRKLLGGLEFILAITVVCQIYIYLMLVMH